MNTTLRTRRGFTLIELLVALLIGLVVLQVAMSFFAQQGRAFSYGVATMNTIQNARYAVNALEKDVRTLGTGVLKHQPALVYGGPDVLAFNADFASSDPNDVFAVYVDRHAPAAQLQAATLLDRFTIPNTAYGYPDTTYLDGEVNGRAETLSFFFEPDATTARADDFVLYRQVNGAGPAVVARNLMRTGESPFFEYLVLAVTDTAPTRLASAGSGPIVHTAPGHNSEADTAASALADSVRAVRVRFTVTSGETGPRERRRVVERTIRMPNAGMADPAICGDEPHPTLMSAFALVLADGTPAVQISWGPSVDENGGESDVLRYVVWRRAGGAVEWGDPFLSFPAGLASYSYVDQSVADNVPVQYAVAAQDCTPSTSALAPSAVVTP